MRNVSFIMVLMIMINCNDFRKTPEQCREELKRFIQFSVFLIEPMARENLKEDHPELTDEEVDREVQRGFIEGLIWWALIIDCIDEPLLDCRKIESMISRPDACIFDPIFR